MKRLLILALLLGLAACNTVDGIGQDISETAKSVKDTL